MATKTEREELLRLLHLIFLYAHMREPDAYGKARKNPHFYLGAIQAASKEALSILRKETNEV